MKNIENQKFLTFGHLFIFLQLRLWGPCGPSDDESNHKVGKGTPERSNWYVFYMGWAQVDSLTQSKVLCVSLLLSSEFSEKLQKQPHSSLLLQNSPQILFFILILLQFLIEPLRRPSSDAQFAPWRLWPFNHISTLVDSNICLHESNNYHWFKKVIKLIINNHF